MIVNLKTPVMSFFGHLEEGDTFKYEKYTNSIFMVIVEVTTIDNYTYNAVALDSGALFNFNYSDKIELVEVEANEV